MKALIQRVKEASVAVEEKSVGQIGQGILIFLGVGADDEMNDVNYLVDKIVNLRIFENDGKRMDKSVLDISGELLVISQFTLFGSTKKGRRPDFINAAKPGKALDLYEKFIEECKKAGLKTEAGEFAAMMDVSLINDGPVTFMLDSKKNY
jgi:D-tyrosyl-tRNA(Tyr) deacylase